MSMIDEIKRELAMPNVRPTKEQVAAMLEYIQVQEKFTTCSRDEWIFIAEELQAARKKLGLE